MSAKINTEKEKIPHPYRIPENFFNDFKTEILENVSKDAKKNQTHFIRFVKRTLVYAAVLVFGFFSVKGIIYTFQKNSETNTGVHSDAEIDAIYSQISDEDITNFIENESHENITEILDF